MMIGLVIKDILNLKNSFRTSLLILALFSFMAYQSQDPTYLMGMFVLIMSIQSISSISYDELAKWDVYALTMPISRVKLVISKYILSIMLSIIALIISGAISYFVILPTSNMNTIEFLLSSYLVFASSILLLSVLLPLIYRYGVEKSRLLIFIVISIPVLIGIFFSKIGIDLPDENQLRTIFKVSPFIIIALLFISSFISCRIYKNKDM
ncbi:MAG TPA: ABC-2 transporter permease [Epulopiscium sp.]|nr:ABC-2 transporter permease [Candidatus Epulonipiscium sp.]